MKVNANELKQITKYVINIKVGYTYVAKSCLMPGLDAVFWWSRTHSGCNFYLIK